MCNHLNPIPYDISIPAILWGVGRSENQKNQKIKNGECFFLCLGIQGTRKIAASLVLGGFS